MITDACMYPPVPTNGRVIAAMIAAHPAARQGIAASPPRRTGSIDPPLDHFST